MSKNLLLTLTLILFSFMSSCSDDDVTETINETFIIGKWTLSSITENGSNVNLNDCQKMESLEFNTSNEVIIKTYSSNSTNSCKINSNNTYDYSVDHSSITIQGIGDSEISTLKNNKTLTLESIESSNTIVKTFNRE
ncbi:lipocalin family protein [Aquimarina aquimarini]|uniref:lipocalin family protein n=1 Tax=Aquimarina aquimarini TaxID=1191734 RepID=UPI000D55F4FC|nr:lipocalin family protein [Aquimarina aquimarini]